MDIPVFHQFFFPVLQFYSDGQAHSIKDLRDFCIRWFKLTPEQQEQMLPSGRQPIVNNRIGWAKTYLTKAACLEKTAYATYKITPLGLKVFQEHQKEQVISPQDLFKIPEFRAFQLGSSEAEKTPVSLKEQTDNNDIPPNEQLENAFQTLNDQLYAQIIQECQKIDCYAFEQLVVDVLINLGYGGPQAKGMVTQKSNDEGIDGIINEDPLGLDKIYIQAKQYSQGTLGRPDIQKFVGALHGKSKKGIFVTTSSFSPKARDYAKTLADTKIILIDGNELAKLMVKSNTGVLVEQNFTLKKIDMSYFHPDE